MWTGRTPETVSTPVPIEQPRHRQADHVAACPLPRLRCTTDAPVRDSGRPQLALDLGAVHDSPAVRVKGIAPVHGASIVPQNEIADPPDVLPGEFPPIDDAPQLVEQRLGVLEV